ncbi:TPM domain-containing protein [Carboxylicivirga sp. A043]|uniref:TPM domain-containing protein n=1 Tax=Carboxylicivirga litoralis TaxID=2816963 RepID=UPI0021CB8032|nr:TPM domain-containing protein [Carboxylicivirga sp. A043]MCU4156768.1 TPM domain-containing protein [Carboxylicivirga sp. A043]
MAKEFFTEEERQRIVGAIKEAELNTSGEIRVHLDKHCNEDVLDSAAYWFEKLQMHKTEQRNGVLFYLAYEDRKFAVLGDAGINQKVPENFWDSIKDQMMAQFKEGRYADGLANGIIESGKQLKQHFPYQSDDVNELSDDISFGDK